MAQILLLAGNNLSYLFLYLLSLILCKLLKMRCWFFIKSQIFDIHYGLLDYSKNIEITRNRRACKNMIEAHVHYVQSMRRNSRRRRLCLVGSKKNWKIVRLVIETSNYFPTHSLWKKIMKHKRREVEIENNSYIFL